MALFWRYLKFEYTRIWGGIVQRVQMTWAPLACANMCPMSSQWYTVSSGRRLRLLSDWEDAPNLFENYAVRICQHVLYAGYRLNKCVDKSWASTRQYLSPGFPTKRDSNQSPRLQRLARKLTFRLKQLANKWITKALTRLRIHAGWSASLLFAYPEDRLSRVEAQKWKVHWTQDIFFTPLETKAFFISFENIPKYLLSITWQL